MRKPTFSLFAILVLALVARCSRDPVAPDLADPGSVQPAADETPSGLGALIDRYESEDELTHDQATSLRAHLTDAEKFDERGDSENADRVYEDMIQQVGGWRDNGEVSSSVAEGLISYIQSLLGNKYVSISAGWGHTCGVRPTGVAYCWGDNSHGQLGDGTNSYSNIPVKVAGNLVFASIEAGQRHTCGLTASIGPRDPGGEAYCWGRNHHEDGSDPDLFNHGGMLGNGTKTDSYVPVKVLGGHTFASISTDEDHTCGVTTAGAAYCWGDNVYYQLGIGSDTNDSTVPVAVAGGLTFAAISAGIDETCALTTTGEPYCWGEYLLLQAYDVPVAVDAQGTTFASIDAGLYSACAVTTAGKAYCWGHNQYGVLGNGMNSNTNTNVPVEVASGHVFSTVDVGWLFACGATTSGMGYCWGDNIYGRFGNGSTNTDSNVPVAVSGGHSFARISAGGYHACGATTAGKGYCWGANEVGQLGDGSNILSAIPVAVAKP